MIKQAGKACIACLLLAVASLSYAQGVRYTVFDGQSYKPEMLESASKMPMVSKPAQMNPDGGSYWIPRAADGHYYVHGSVNGHPLVFMIDTGASHTVIPASLAKNSGIRAGKEVKTNTASGGAVAAESDQNRITVGPYVIQSSPVLVAQGTATSLLGMSVLMNFSIAADSSGMSISPKKPR